MNEHPGSRFIRALMNKKLALCAAVFAVSLGTATAQFTYTGGTLSTSQTYDGLGVDSGLNPFSITTLADDYITSGATLRVLSGTLSINANDFKIGNGGSAGTLILGANATMNINNIGQWGGALAWYTDNVGTLIISNNATLNWVLGGSQEQRFAIGGGQPSASGTVTLYGGAMNVSLTNTVTLNDNESEFSIGGANSTGTVNLNAGTLTDSMPLPACLGCYYTLLLSSPTLGQSTSVNLMNILNGTFAVTGIFATDPNYPDRASFNVGTNSYVCFRGGTGSLSLANWSSADYAVLVNAGQIRIGFPGQPGVQTTMSSFAYTSVGGQGILKAIVPFVIPATIASQPPAAVSVIAGRTLQLTAGVGGSEPISYQWQLNGTNIANLVDNANFTGANTNTLTILSMTANDVGLYRLIVSNSFPPAATSSVASITLNTNAHLVGKWFTGASSLADVSGYQVAGTHDGYDAVGTGNYGYTNDVPAGKSGQALRLFAGDTGIAINNSSTLDAAYTNTFDETINSSMTVACWAKGLPGGWNPWVSKYGEGGVGWQLRVNGSGNTPCWTIRGPGGDDMSSTIGSVDGNWHAYVGTFDAATGIRKLYVDGVLAATLTGQGPTVSPATSSHVVIGGRDNSGNNFGNFFTGNIYDARVYNYDLTAGEAAQYSAVPDPSIVGQPQSATAYVGGTAQMRATTRGSAPMTNHWQFNGVNLVDGFRGGAIISGSTSNVLTISYLTTSVQGVYRLILSNPNGTVIGSNATLTVLSAVPPSAANLVGAWFTGAANLADSSGYTPAGTHNGYGVTGANTPSVNYAFSSDVPPGQPAGLSLSLNGTTAIVISNSSSTLDGAYVNTFDDTINADGMTVTAWAKGLPGGWSPWVSKNGEGVGWQLRVNGSGSTPCWSVRGTSGNDDMSGGSVDSNWHFYAGTYSSGTGIRNLYVDGVLAATQSGDTGPLGTALAQRLVIGARDNNGDDLGSYFTGKIYGVRIYKTALSESEVNSFIRSVPVFVGQPVLNGNQLVLTWAGGSLLSATNVVGPYLPVAGATSPYTNIILSTPQKFFRLSNP